MDRAEHAQEGHQDMAGSAAIVSSNADITAITTDNSADVSGSNSVGTPDSTSDGTSDSDSTSDSVSTDDSHDGRVTRAVVLLEPSMKSVSVDFPQFPRFPLEIQAMIWLSSIPRGPIIYPYCLDYESDDVHSLPPDEVTMKLHRPAMAAASRDARRAMMTWAAKRGSETILWPWMGPMFRHLHPKYDILYFRPDSYLNDECWGNSQHGPCAELRGWTVPVHRSGRAAAHKTALLDKYFIRWMVDQVTELYIICNGPSKLVECRQIGGSCRGAWVWDTDKDKERINFEPYEHDEIDAEHDQLSSCYEGVDVLIAGLVDELVHQKITYLEIWPVTILVY